MSWSKVATGKKTPLWPNTRSISNSPRISKTHSQSWFYRRLKKLLSNNSLSQTPNLFTEEPIAWIFQDLTTSCFSVIGDVLIYSKAPANLGVEVHGVGQGFMCKYIIYKREIKHKSDLEIVCKIDFYIIERDFCKLLEKPNKYAPNVFSHLKNLSIYYF